MAVLGEQNGGNNEQTTYHGGGECRSGRVLATPAQPRRESKLLSTWNLVGDCVTYCHMLVTFHLRDGDALGNGPLEL